MVTCIISFYNEQKERISKIIGELEKIKEISQIICIDDGSETNDLFEHLQKTFKNIVLIKLDDNKGKSYAIKAALEKARNQIILLMDSDLEGVKTDEMRDALQVFVKKDLDLLIFQVKTKPWQIDSIFNRYVVLSGTRIIKKSDLESIIHSYHPQGYQLESAINDYFMKSDSKKVFWIPCSFYDIHKQEKIGFLNGQLKNIQTELNIISFIGIRNHIEQMFFFGRRKITE